MPNIDLDELARVNDEIRDARRIMDGLVSLQAGAMDGGSPVVTALSVDEWRRYDEASETARRAEDERRRMYEDAGLIPRRGDTGSA